MKFVKNIKYYSGIVYEWNLPTGSTCPFALECKVSVNRETGKFNNESNQYRCYAANPERFPAVREHRWKNFEGMKRGEKPIIPKEAKSIRIHASGDFFNQKYFDLWLEICRENPSIEFWAYTKSLDYWVNRINDIPSNLVLTASEGGRRDELISEYGLKHVKIFSDSSLVPSDIPIDTNDDYARNRDIKVFALVDNFKQKKK